MNIVSLNGAWKLTYGPQQPDSPTTPQQLASSNWPTVPATVPGNVELDLIAAGKLPAELARGNNVYQLRELENHDWWYQRTFPTPAFSAGHRVILAFGGIDCLASIYLNGQLIGQTDNMLIEHRFDVTDGLRQDGENELQIRLASPILAARKHTPTPGEHAPDGSWESLAIRKAPHMYGWDIMPRIISAGLWREVNLEIFPPTHWRNIYWTTLAIDLERRSANVMVDWDFVTQQSQVDQLRLRITIARGGSALHQSEHRICYTHGRHTLHLSNVDFWWPRGMGAAALYDATLDLLDAAGNTLCSHKTRLGIRTIELRRSEVTTPDKPGEFLFLVNGQGVFIKGTNWVPLDALHSRDAAHLGEVFAMVADLNCNMLRCWGGNVYEDHAFFDLCDQAGVMVWQDFALACAIYPQDDDFAARIRQEAQAIVTKLRNHPSLALWAGNNEIDEAYGWARTRLDPNIADRLSRQVLPDVIRRLDPLRHYLPSSPYRSPALVAAGNYDLLKPEDHLWGPRDDFKGRFYISSPAHFVSEIGYHGCPSYKSLAQMMDGNHLWPWMDNDQWLTHAVRPQPQLTQYNYRIPLMANQITVLFESAPTEIEDFVLASQISQAEALKFLLERWRMGKWRRTGMLWWNLRDGWPIISDAVVDYYNRKKIAYGYLKRLQADVCIMCGEPIGKNHVLMVANDTLKTVDGTFRIRDANLGQVLFQGKIHVEPNSNAPLGGIPASARPTMWLIDWTLADGTKGQNHYLAGPRPFKLADYRRWLDALNDSEPILPMLAGLRQPSASLVDALQ